MYMLWTNLFIEMFQDGLECWICLAIGDMFLKISAVVDWPDLIAMILKGGIQHSNWGCMAVI